MQTTSRQIVDWLLSLPNVTSASPMQVRIGRQSYPAALYTSTMTVSPGCRAYEAGQRSYQQTMIYCAGPLPSAKRRGNVAFTIDGDARDWYVACYATQEAAENPQYAEFHPFGQSFQLAPWDIADSRIDQYARVPYRRVAIRADMAGVVRYIALSHNGDPYGRGFTGTMLETRDATTGIYRGDIGARSRAWWRRYARLERYTLIEAE